MRIPTKLTATTAALALGITSAAVASGHDNHGRSQSAPGHSTTQQTSSTGTGTTTTTPPSTHSAFGRVCQGESKRHVAGQKGTPFSNCVTDMAKVAASAKTNPARACANESKRHVAGQKGTPFSQCVVAAAKLRGNQGTQPQTGS